MPIYFGPAGNPDSFAAAGHKSSLDMPAFLKAFGLNAYEYQCGNGVTIGEASAKKLGEKAREAGVRLSIHAPYYISMSGEDDEKRLGSLRYISASCVAARSMGADRVIFHPGGLGKSTREQALERAFDTLRRALAMLDEAGLGDISLCPETMGKINQLGTLEEILALCSLDERLVPCVDFGHINARTQGGMKTRADFASLFDQIEAALGRKRAASIHCHFSHIQYSKGGEVRHLTFADEEYGPFFEPLAELIAERGYEPVIICESAGTQAEDARAMLLSYEECLKNIQNQGKV